MHGAGFRNFVGSLMEVCTELGSGFESVNRAWVHILVCSSVDGGMRLQSTFILLNRCSLFLPGVSICLWWKFLEEEDGLSCSVEGKDYNRKPRVVELPNFWHHKRQPIYTNNIRLLSFLKFWVK